MDYFQHRCSLLINLLLPQSCALCNGSAEGRHAVCSTCASGLPSLPSSCCPVCADFSPAAALCGRCVTSPPFFDQVRAPFLYANPTDRLIYALKYGHHLRLAKWLGERMSAQLSLGAAERRPFDAIIPLPLHPSRMRSRGFNQAMEIARPIGRNLRIPTLSQSVFRIHDTWPQADLSREQRQHNIRNAFECRTEFGGKSLLIIDDVLTTGSSASELARVLKLHGATRVTIAVAARTHHH